MPFPTVALMAPLVLWERALEAAFVADRFVQFSVFFSQKGRGKDEAHPKHGQNGQCPEPVTLVQAQHAVGNNRCNEEEKQKIDGRIAKGAEIRKEVHGCHVVENWAVLRPSIAQRGKQGKRARQAGCRSGFVFHFAAVIHANGWVEVRALLLMVLRMLMPLRTTLDTQYGLLWTAPILRH